MTLLLALLLALGAQAEPPAAGEASAPREGRWRAWLESPGGELPFGLELARGAGGWRAVIENGGERIELSELRVEAGRVTLALPHYAAEISAALARDGARLEGEWTRLALGGARARLPFRAELWSGESSPPRFTPSGEPPAASLAGRWRARFDSSAEDALLLLEQEADGRATGTFLTTTGDYRYLAGSLEGSRLRLSAFDGAHAFLFDATLGEDGTLAGRFFSRESWSEGWRAERDATAELADLWRLVEARAGYPLALARFPDLRDERGAGLRSLAEPALSGRPAVIEIFGSWCPNCHDAGRWLAALRARVGAPQLALVGLAFELTGDFAADRAQVLRYARRHELEQGFDLLLLGGTADKARASEALPFLSALKAFPTLVLVDRAGRVRSVYTGFAGPATGAAHERETAELERRILALVLEPEPEPDAERLALLGADLWREEPLERLWGFAADGSFELSETYRFGAPTPAEPAAQGRWRFVGDCLESGGERFAFDARAGALLDPADAGRRLRPAARPRLAVVDGLALDAPEALALALAGTDPLARREALYFLALERVFTARLPPEHAPEPGPRDALELELARALSDQDPLVRTTAAWAAGALGDARAREALATALRSGHAALRREAARALSRLGPTATERAALEELARDIDPEVRAAAGEALAR